MELNETKIKMYVHDKGNISYEEYIIMTDVLDIQLIFKFKDKLGALLDAQEWDSSNPMFVDIIVNGTSRRFSFEFNILPEDILKLKL